MVVVWDHSRLLDDHTTLVTVNNRPPKFVDSRLDRFDRLSKKVYCFQHEFWVASFWDT